ncbi:uncharacterized protein LOC142332068 [Lycorma delicatula]|uniref:uncharacterized protein LOC142332068 n=1 Tax=Lycorma delicatula TaxID=130591 RepID=UPI003F515F23
MLNSISAHFPPKSDCLLVNQILNKTVAAMALIRFKGCCYKKQKYKYVLVVPAFETQRYRTHFLIVKQNFYVCLIWVHCLHFVIMYGLKVMLQLIMLNGDLPLHHTGWLLVRMMSC